MKLQGKTPPRRFLVGNEIKFEMKDCGELRLDPDEQITLTTPDGAEYDVARKIWGFYATPSLNSRLLSFGLRAVLVKNPIGRYFVMLVEQGKEELFDDYMRAERLELICRMDTSAELEKLESCFRDKK